MNNEEYIMMNNEEKILALLEKHGKMLEEMRGDISQMQETLTRVAVTQEGVVLPRIQLALEGHSELNRKMDTLAPKERVEVLEDEVITLKTVVKSLSNRLAALEQAQ